MRFLYPGVQDGAFKHASVVRAQCWVGPWMPWHGHQAGLGSTGDGFHVPMCQKVWQRCGGRFWDIGGSHHHCPSVGVGRRRENAQQRQLASHVARDLNQLGWCWDQCRSASGVCCSALERLACTSYQRHGRCRIHGVRTGLDHNALCVVEVAHQFVHGPAHRGLVLQQVNCAAKDGRSGEGWKKRRWSW